MIEWVKNWFSKPEERKAEIAEDISGNWTYHLKRPSESKALCGRRTMPSKVTKWGSKRPSHITMSYCPECEEIAVNQNISIQ